MFACGNNRHGQLGFVARGKTRQTPALVQAFGLTNAGPPVIQVAACEGYPLCLTVGGIVYEFGVDVRPGLTKGAASKRKGRYIPAQIPGLNGVVQISTSSAYVLGDRRTAGLSEDGEECSDHPVLLPGITDVLQVAARPLCSLFIRARKAQSEQDEQWEGPVRRYCGKRRRYKVEFPA